MSSIKMDLTVKLLIHSSETFVLVDSASLHSRAAPRGMTRQHRPPASCLSSGDDITARCGSRQVPRPIPAPEGPKEKKEQDVRSKMAKECLKLLNWRARSHFPWYNPWHFLEHSVHTQTVLRSGRSSSGPEGSSWRKASCLSGCWGPSSSHTSKPWGKYKSRNIMFYDRALVGCCSGTDESSCLWSQRKNVTCFLWNTETNLNSCVSLELATSKHFKSCCLWKDCHFVVFGSTTCVK